MKPPLSRYTVSGNSMTPSLKPGQDVLSFNWAYLGKRPKVGDIVIVKSEKLKMKSEIIKRIKKIEGDQVYLTGDNLAESTDSREFGAVNMDQIVGKVIYKASHPGESVTLSEAKGISSSASPQNDRMVDCPQCGFRVIGIYGRKDAICKNCGFKLACCGEP